MMRTAPFPRTTRLSRPKAWACLLTPFERDSARANSTTDNGRQFKHYRIALQNFILTNHLL